MTRILITGSAGLLGKALAHTAPPDADITLLYRTKQPKQYRYRMIQHDLRKPIDLTDINPEVIIHCAGEGSVDKVQANPSLGMDCILAPTINIINEAERLKAKLVYISTNAVFDGTRPPYREDDLLCPINSYGIFKASCELAVRGSLTDWLVIRPLLMYGWENEGQRKNWASIWIEKLGRKEPCKVVNDVISQPLYNMDCAYVIWKALKWSKWKEIFNVAGGDAVVLSDFAKLVARKLKVDEVLVEPVSSSTFPNLAPRPKDTSYDLAKIHRILGHTPMALHEGIRRMLEEPHA